MTLPGGPRLPKLHVLGAPQLTSFFLIQWISQWGVCLEDVDKEASQVFVGSEGYAKEKGCDAV